MRSKVSSMKGQADSSWLKLTGLKLSHHFEPRNRTFTDDDTTLVCSTNDFPNHCHCEDESVTRGSSKSCCYLFGPRLLKYAAIKTNSWWEKKNSFRTSEFGVAASPSNKSGIVHKHSRESAYFDCTQPHFHVSRAVTSALTDMFWGWHQEGRSRLSRLTRF